ncbi:hypothetical protein MC885_020754 [Smutsia gigantea]|nr:hypothetical protein MC885_020754 [Smutsia gigantea]
MHFKSGLELNELQNMTVPEDDNISNDSNDFTEVENGQINSKFISDRESRRSLTNSQLEKKNVINIVFSDPMYFRLKPIKEISKSLMKDFLGFTSVLVSNGASKAWCDELCHGLFRFTVSVCLFTQAPGTASLGMSAFDLSNAIMGSGILGLAFALANTGILLFLALLTSVTLMSIYSINLLLACSKETGCMVYEKLGEQVLGTTGKLVIFGATSLENIGAMLSYLFIVKNELPSAIKFLMGKEESFLALFPNVYSLLAPFGAWYVDGHMLVVMVTFGIILPLCLLKNLGYLGYTSGFSLSCMVFFPNSDGNLKVFQKNGEETQGRVSPTDLSQHPLGIKEVVLSRHNYKCNYSCRSQKKMQMVSNISFFPMFVMYLLTAVFGYLTFYGRPADALCSLRCPAPTSGNVQSDLLHKYRSRDDVLVLTVRPAVVVAVILAVPVLFFTVRSSLFELAKKTKFNLCRHAAVTVTLLVIINLLVIFIPSMKDIFGVVGVTSANALIFILPSSLYLKITNQDGDKGTQRMWAALFLGLGVLFSLVSIPLVIYDWACSSSGDECH